ncbi:MAG: putative modification methylase [Prokaryotic dsDNA virus sp.]|nr:MAG: putative modification methylase [Prokaryotic dsDNA virus sp.]|tara:strand:- start:1258 stop:2124 length:867 start_codon:yes stop_codon:yes gene_type:complete
MTIDIKIGDCREVLKQFDAESFDCCITSPPYFGLRDYGVDDQIGKEKTPTDFVSELVNVFAEVHRVLKPTGTLWLNLGDSYCNSNGYARASADFQRQGRNNASANDRNLSSLHNDGYKTKDLIGISWKVAFALQEFGWYLRQDIIWSKPNPMPESVRDRCTKSHEYIFLLSKQPKYYFDNEAIKENVEQDRGTYEKRNKRSVWSVSSKPFSGAHFATFPPDLIEPCVLAGCPEGGHILDPFGGAGTTALVADRFKRNATLIELNNEYAEIAKNRLQGDAPLFSEIEVA